MRVVGAICFLVAAVIAPLVAQAPNQAARMAGRVIAADTGAPVRSAGIRLVGMGAGQGTLVATTDDDGRFEFSEVGAGQYLLQVSKAGFVTSTFGLNGRTSAAFGVSAGQQIDLRNLQLPRAGVVSGRIFDVFGDPIADVSVTAWRLEYFTTPARRRVTSQKSFQSDDRGEFRIYGLQPGKYYVSASRTVVAVTEPPGAAGPTLTNTGLREAPTFYPGTTNAMEALAVEVKAGEEARGLQMQLLTTAYGAVSGVVTTSKGAPYDASVVGLVPARADSAEFSTVQLMAQPDRQGQFRIVNVSPGDYRAEIFSRAYLENVGKTGSVGLGEVPPGEMASVPVTVVSGQTAQLSIQASPGFRVRGRVFVDGAPAVADGSSKLSVSAYPTTSAISAQAIPVLTQVAGDGSFSMAGLLGSRTFSATGAAGATLYRTVVRGLDVSETGVEITSDTDDVEVHLTTRPSRLEGSAKETDGAVASTGRLIVYSTDRADWLRPATRRYRSILIKGNGTFSMVGLPAGNYLVAVVAADNDRYADPDFLEALRSVATPVAIADAGTTTVAVVKR